MHRKEKNFDRKKLLPWVILLCALSYGLTTSTCLQRFAYCITFTFGISHRRIIPRRGC